jgi:spermidine synthase
MPIPTTKRQRQLLLISAAVSSSCGLAIELLLGTLASYLVGNQALAYGVAVGGFLAAMGIGSYVSKFIATDDKSVSLQQDLLSAFIKVELLIAPLIAFLPLGLFGLFVRDGNLWLGLSLATTLLGILAGLEVPLLTRILELESDLKDALAGVLALDYIGALLGSIAFPLVLLPFCGLFPTGFIIGTLQAMMVFLIGAKFPRLKYWKYLGLSVAIFLIALTPISIPFANRLENNLYQAPIIKRIQSQYQRIVLTRQGQDLRLFLDGDLQLSTIDEYRYHEALVHPAMSASKQPKKVLIMGAGDGMALREVLKWPTVEKVVLIELDPAVVQLASNYPQLIELNHNAFADPRVRVIYGDALLTVPKLSDRFDAIFADFPDPDRDIIAKLYSEGFYLRLLDRLSENGMLVTQASSPFFAPKVISCIDRTLQYVGLQTFPYVIDVPSFGSWGFVLASRHKIIPQNLKLPIATRFLTESLLSGLFNLPGDIKLQKVAINRLSYPVIVRYQSDRKWFYY